MALSEADAQAGEEAEIRGRMTQTDLQPAIDRQSIAKVTDRADVEGRYGSASGLLSRKPEQLPVWVPALDRDARRRRHEMLGEVPPPAAGADLCGGIIGVDVTAGTKVDAAGEGYGVIDVARTESRSRARRRKGDCRRHRENRRTLRILAPAWMFPNPDCRWPASARVTHPSVPMRASIQLETPTRARTGDPKPESPFDTLVCVAPASICTRPGATSCALFVTSGRSGSIRS